MAIYLKRESAIADTIQDPDKTGNDLDQIEKDIAGDNGIAAHEEEVEDAAEGVIDDPAKGLMDGDEIAESCYMALYESEYNFNQIIECIDIHTLRAASMDRDLVLEANDIKGFFTTVKEAIISAFKKFTEIITNIMNKIKSFFVNNKKFVADNAENIKKGFAKIGTTDNEILGLPYNHAELGAIVKELDDAAGMTPEDSAIGIMTKDSRATEGSDKRDELYEKFRMSLCKKFVKGGGNDVTSVGDILRHIEDRVVGKDKVDLRKHYTSYDQLKGILESNSSAEIANSYKKIKAEINTKLKSLDEKAAKAREGEKGKDAEGYSANDFKFTANCIKFYQQCVQQVCTTVSRLRVNEIAQARMFANKCIAVSGKKYHESYYEEDDTYVSESSVFANVNLI